MERLRPNMVENSSFEYNSIFEALGNEPGKVYRGIDAD